MYGVAHFIDAKSASCLPSKAILSASDSYHLLVTRLGSAAVYVGSIPCGSPLLLTIAQETPVRLWDEFMRFQLERYIAFSSSN